MPPAHDQPTCLSLNLNRVPTSEFKLTLLRLQATDVEGKGCHCSLKSKFKARILEKGLDK